MINNKTTIIYGTADWAKASTVGLMFHFGHKFLTVFPSVIYCITLQVTLLTTRTSCFVGG